MSSVRYAVFPVAGLGTRFLPATKSVAKELLPILDRPLIEYAVAECEAAGIERLVLVTNRLKNSLIDHFERDENLERLLHRSGKEQQLQRVRNLLPADIKLINVRQPRPLGLGNAVLCARDVVGDSPFAVLLPDDLLVPQGAGPSPALKTMVECWERTGQSVVAVEEVAAERVSDYGVIDPGDQLAEGFVEVRGLVEKPAEGQAPSRFGVVGRYVLSSQVFDHLHSAEAARPEGEELQLTDSIHALVPEVCAWPLQCRRYDCGSKTGFLRANLAAAARDPELRRELQQFAADFTAESAP